MVNNLINIPLDKVEPLTAKKIKISISGMIFRGTLNETKTANEIYRAIPFQSKGEVWGQELYFYIPVKTGNEKPVTEVKLGDLAYWPEGHALCIFFGPTPMSTGTAIIPAAPVTVVGKIQCKPNSFPHLRNYIIKIDKDLTI